MNIIMIEEGDPQGAQMSDIEKKDAAINKLTAEKNWLLQELNHRVRNILQVVLSLLNAQIYYLKDDVALQAIKESQRRMFAISLIHKKLYISGDSGRISMRQYINELIEHLTDSFGVRKSIVFEKDIEEIVLDVSQAVPLGLILNEAVSNAIEYAFPSIENGAIQICLFNSGAGQIELLINDNGVGLNSSVSSEENGQLGMNLIRGLTKDLDGTFSAENNGGTRICVRFCNHLND